MKRSAKRSAACLTRDPVCSSRSSTSVAPIFRQTAAYGHFGRTGSDFTWEQTPHVDALREAAGWHERRV